MCYDGIYKYGRSRLYGRQPSSYDIDLKKLIEINGVYIEVYNEQRYYTLFELCAKVQKVKQYDSCVYLIVN